MSYDLHLLRRETIGDDPSAAYEALEEVEERKPSAEEEARLRELAAELQAANPGLDLTEPPQGFLLQLGYEAERPVVIDIGGIDDITMMWSYGADEAAPAIAEVRLYLPVFERYGYVAFDRQLDRLFDVERDSDAAAEVHADVRDKVFDCRTIGARPAWWRRLFGR
jgi:hypothetical protein